MKIYQILILLFLITLLTSVFTYIYVLDVIENGRIPSIEELENPDQSLASRVYSSDGKLLDYYFEQKRVNLTFDEIPEAFIEGLIAAEDREFFNHWGLHLNRIIRAAFKYILLRDKEGGSTITQQLARTLYLDQASTINRKIREAYTAVKIEERYTKDEILEMYINGVYFGHGAYGLYTAANVYFGKNPHELNINEIAYLIGVINMPGRFDAFKNYEKAISRKNIVLSMMYDQSLINKNEYVNYRDSDLFLNYSNEEQNISNLAPHYIEDIRKLLGTEEFLKGQNLYTDGLTIQTSLNGKIQEYVNNAVAKHLNEYQELFNKSWNWSKYKTIEAEVIRDAILRNPEYKKTLKENKANISNLLKKDKDFIDSVKNDATTIQCGVIVLESQSGAILAMTGASPKFMKDNFHYKHSLNHTNQIYRQPGSAIKPFVYAMAIKESNLSADSDIDCGPFTYYNRETGETWSPRTGSDDCPPGTIITLREGLKKSINSVAARLITEYTSPQAVKNLLNRAGVKSPLGAYPALSLGAGGEVKPIEMASAYTIFPNQGLRIEPYYITKIEDQYGNHIFEKKKSAEVTDVIDSYTCSQVISMMKDVVTSGTAARVRKYFDNWAVEIAGKTGTTNDNADAWFIGYSPEIVICVWVGFDNQRVTFDVLGRNGQGGRAAAPIFGYIMKDIYSDTELNYKKYRFDFTKSADTVKTGNATVVY